MPALATWAPEDGVLGAVAPLALATSQPTALVVDLDPNGPAYPSGRSLRQLVEDGPRAVDLAPSESGVAVLANGGVGLEDARHLVDLLVSGWPAVVLRLAPQAPVDVPVPLVPVRLLVPGGLFPPQGRGVYQPLGPVDRRARGLKASGSVVLPMARRRVVERLLVGSRPVAGKWMVAWRRVWDTPW